MNEKIDLRALRGRERSEKKARLALNRINDREADAARKAEVAALNKAAVDGSIPDDLNPLFVFGQTAAELLVAIVAGKLDPVQLAKEELASRGQGRAGAWIGVKRAEAEWGL